MTDATTVLIVEDEPKLARVLADYLHAANFASRWIANGAEVESAVRDETPQLILLDLMLPGRDGVAVCRDLRAFTDVPIIMVTARVKAVLRRTERASMRSANSRLAVDQDAHSATLDGHSLDLTPVEFRLLAALHGESGRVLRRDKLVTRLYVDHRVVTARTVDSHVKNLRHKLAAAANGEDLIRSVYGVGYRLEL